MSIKSPRFYYVEVPVAHYYLISVLVNATLFFLDDTRVFMACGR